MALAVRSFCSSKVAHWASVLPVSYRSYLKDGPRVRNIPYLQVWRCKTFLSPRSGQFQVKNNSSTIQISNSSAIQKSDLYFCQRRTGGVLLGISKQDRFKSNSRGVGVVFRVLSGCSSSGISFPYDALHVHQSSVKSPHGMTANLVFPPSTEFIFSSFVFFSFTFLFLFSSSWIDLGHQTRPRPRTLICATFPCPSPSVQNGGENGEEEGEKTMSLLHKVARKVS